MGFQFDQIIESKFGFEEWLGFIKRRFNPITEGLLPNPVFLTPEQPLVVFVELEIIGNKKLQDHLTAHQNHIHHSYAGIQPTLLGETEHILRGIQTKFGVAVIRGKSYRLQSPSIVLNGYAREPDSEFTWSLCICDTNPNSEFAKLAKEPLQEEEKDVKMPPQPVVIMPPELERTTVHA